jgi:hypothetical protein
MKILKRFYVLYKSLYYLNHKDNTKEIVYVCIYKEKLPESKNDCYYFKFPYVTRDLGNECLAKYLTKINFITKIKIITKNE